MLYLRDIINAGFCGTKIASSKPAKPSVYTKIDETVLRQRGSIHLMEHEDARIQMANFVGVPYADQKIFHQCLLGINKHKNLLQSESVRMEKRTAKMSDGDDIEYLWAYDHSTGEIIELCYNFIIPDYYTPLYALLAAHLYGLQNGSVKVKIVSALGDFTRSGLYPLQPQQLSEFLAQSLVPSHMTPGPQCVSCPSTNCSFNLEFDGLVYEWMKAKQREEELRKQLREFLVMHGPTKSGVHLVFLKEGVRRYFIDARRKEFVEIANKHLTVDDLGACFKPDASKVFEMVSNGKLPESVKDMFSVSRSYSIDTELSL